MANSEGYKLDENGKPVKDTKSTKAAPKAKAKAKAAPKADGEKGAPRPRKYDYGIKPQNMVSAVDPKAEVKLKAKEAEGYELAVKGCSVDDFLAVNERGVLRRLARKGLVQIKGENGTMYPKPYEAPEAGEAA